MLCSYFHAHVAILADYPQGRPPTSYDEHADSFFRCVTQIKHRACGHLDFLLEFEALVEQFMCVFNKLKGTQLSHGLFGMDEQVGEGRLGV